MNARAFAFYMAACAGSLIVAAGCCGPRESRMGPAYDRPFPLGQVTDSFWETQQTNAEAADFIFYRNEFVQETTELTPGGRKHLLQVATRLPHVPFPVVIEEGKYELKPDVDAARRKAIIDQLVGLGYDPAEIEPRVVVANAFPEGQTAIEAEATYHSVIRGWGDTSHGWNNHRYGGWGGTYR